MNYQRLGVEAKTMAVTQEQIRATLNVVVAVGEAIKAAGTEGIPSGHLYAMLTGKLSLGDYEACIRTLKNVGVVAEKNHVLTWIKMGIP